MSSNHLDAELMPKGGRNIIGKLIAGIAMLTMLLVFAAPASAHGQAADRSIERQSLVQSVSSQLSIGDEIAGGGCSGCMSCCIFGQCSMVPIAFPTIGGVGYRPRPTTAAYGGMIVATTIGLWPGPATPPPRVNI